MLHSKGVSLGKKYMQIQLPFYVTMLYISPSNIFSQILKNGQKLSIHYMYTWSYKIPILVGIFLETSNT